MASIRSSHSRALLVATLSLALSAGGSLGAQPRFPAPTDPVTQRLMTRLAALSADSMEGRRAGTAGSQRARRFLIGELQAMGVAPAGSSYEQVVRWPSRNGNTDTVGANIVARIPGTRTGGATIVLSAHYDHLGTRNGQIYNGADDDASGCIALLALAERLKAEPIAHDVVLAFFDGEEIGMPGSKAFVATPPVPSSRIAFNLNLDMVSRQDGKALWVSGTAHHPSLKAVAERVSRSASVPVQFGHDTRGGKPGDDWTNSSDHASFHAKGIPFLYLGVEDHADYHQPGDDVEKIDPTFYRGVVDFAFSLLKEVDAWVATQPTGRGASGASGASRVSGANALDAAIDAARGDIARDLTHMAAIRSPSGFEHERARWVADRMRALGLADVTMDSAPNVVGRIKGRATDAAKHATVYVATLDDLAPVAEHQARAKRAPFVDGDRVMGPGTNTSSTTAAMLGAAAALLTTGAQPDHDIVFAAVAREETGLVGMKTLYAQWRDRADAFVDILGDGRSITYGAIGIHWWQVWAFQPGGHTLTGGLPNVNLGVARAVDRILSLPQPAPSSRTVLNVSMLRAGDVFNRKPDSAWFSLDIRSLDAPTITRNETAVRAVLDSVSRETGTRFDMRAVQQTAGGQIAGAATSRLVTTATTIATSLGVKPQLGNAGSSNLNVAIAGGTLAIGLGGERGGARGEPGEFADIPSMLRTAKLVARLAAEMSRAQ